MMRKLASLAAPFDGLRSLGSGPVYWTFIFLLIVAAGIFGITDDPYDVGNATYFLVWTFMGLGLCLQWGYGGFLNFGQTAFFGIAGYAYSVATTDLGGSAGVTIGSLVGAIGFSGLIAACLGYFMFYGGIKDILASIITLVTTLLLETFFSQTAGPEWSIGKARLGGFNGMTSMSPLALPWFGGPVTLRGRSLFFAVLVLLVAVFLALRWLVNSGLGRTLVAVRESPLRAEMLGYDPRAYQLFAFVLGCMLASLSGVLYVGWGQYIDPGTMGLQAAIMPVIWVAVAGRTDLTAALIGTLVIVALSQLLDIYGSGYALFLLGAILLAIVLIAPDGFMVAPWKRLAGMHRSLRMRRASTSKTVSAPP